MFKRMALAAGLFVAVAAPLLAADDSSIARLRKDLTYLTSDECEGRGAQTQGIHKAAAYIAAEFEKLGLKPTGTKGYLQPFPMLAGKATPGDANRLILKGPLGQELELKYDAQFRPLGFSVAGKAAAPLVFAGYGISYPQGNYDDYEGLDAAGKIVVVLRKAPAVGADGKPFAGGGRTANQLASLSNKLITAAAARAKAVLIVNDAESAAKGDAFMPFDYTSQASPPVDFPSAQMGRAQLDSILRTSTGRGLDEIERDIGRTAKPQSQALAGWSASLDESIVRHYVDVSNIIGVMEGKGPLAGEYIVIGAHYDHLGRGELGSLERDAKKRLEFHRGADDNGSGTVSVIELARRLTANKDYEGRSIVFMNFAGEEQGLLGSQFFCKHPTVPLEKVAAMVNLDMVGRLRPDKGKNKGKLEVGGVGSAKEFTPLVDELNKQFDFDLAKSASAFGPSDHTSFAEKKVPVFFLFTGLHTEYHRPADTIATINFDGMEKIVDFAEELVRRLARLPKPVYVATAASMSAGAGDVPRIGFMPGNYNDSSAKGVLVGGVSDNGPAAKAGLKEGDFIVEIAGKPIKNMSGYMTVMALQKKGQPLELVIEREGKRQKVTVKPE